MKHLTHQLFRNSSTLGGRVLVNTGALASANLWRIVVSFLVQLLVARLLGLEALGQYTVAMAYLNISQVLCEMGLPLWLIRTLAQAPQLRRAYFQRSALLQVAAALLLWGLLVGLASLLPYLDVTRRALFWVGASLPLFAVTSAAASIFQAAERMPLAFAVEFTTNFLILLLSLWWLAQGRGVDALLLVVVIAQGIGMAFALVLLLGNGLLGGSQSSTPQSLRDFVAGALPFFGLSLADVAVQRLDILLLSLLGDARLLGAYSAAYNLVRVAVKLLQSVWRGVYPTLARLYPTAPAEARRVAWRLLGSGLAFCTLGALLAGVWATPLLRLVYGMPDAGVAHVLQWLLWQAPLFYLELYATTWLLVIQRANRALWITIVHVLLLVLLLPLGAILGGATGAAVGTLAAQSIATMLALWSVRTRQA